MMLLLVIGFIIMVRNVFSNTAPLDGVLQALRPSMFWAKMSNQSLV